MTALPASADAVVTLGMYDPPYLHAAQDQLWAALRRALVAEGVEDSVGHLPIALDRDRTIGDALADPRLALGHTCGYPLRTLYAGRLKPVATPVYASPFARDGWHCSAIVVRAEDPARTLADLRGRVAAINGRDSNTGMNLFRATVAPLAEGRPFFARVIETGGHLISLAAVTEGRADVATIDGVTFALAARHAPERVAGVKVIGETPATPALPLVVPVERSEAYVAAVRRALEALLADESAAPARAAFGLTGFAHIAEAEYDRVLELERAAVAAGYPTLA
ncbi:PhnD/SsuA/transferrin family substrate-binding protein [Ancylobacter sp. WKF20]|uniref:phosphate/phosphite/phosphonate ABC transporter substrate-binding protein n=1 Tax=Ancylobacter sp. WKF20 TaxID=3039801 RepID=UPI0024343993|nr:PhnD/SsuA/transferrin family substrate-binding protein [Ancylobacter sp. WKF20]WGD31040.1 PhnD/SsuA/transferrin family substrate-binding protein [Ancylobacter sp. WKF20]